MPIGIGIFYYILNGGENKLAISRARKKELVAQYVDLFQNSQAVFLGEYTGMSVKQVEVLRNEVRDANGSFHIAKNTLLRVAMEEAGVPVPTDMLTGQTAIGFATGEAPTVAKVIVEYAKKEEQFIIRGGLMDNAIISDGQIKDLASMPSLDELRGSIVGVISAPARNIAGLMMNSVRQVVNVLDAYSKEEDGAAEAA